MYEWPVVMTELCYHVRTCRWGCEARESQRNINTSLPCFHLIIFHVDKLSDCVAQLVIVVEHRMDFSIRAATLEDCKDVSRMILVSARARAHVSYACVHF